MATKKTPSKTSRATSKKKNINWLILCLIVVSFTSLGVSILAILNTQKSTAKWMLEEEDLSLSILKNKDLMENASEKIITMNEGVTSLNNDIGDVEKRLKQLEGVVGKSMWSEEQELLAEIEQILKLANNGLIVTGDFNFSLRALLLIHSMLTPDEKSGLVQLQEVIAQDIQRIKASPVYAIKDTLEKLELLLQNDNRALVSIDPDLNQKQENSFKGEGWRMFLNKIFEEAKSLVNVTKYENKKFFALNSDQYILVRENLRLRLLSANTSLYLGDFQKVQENLIFIKNALESYFDTNTSEVRQAILKLEELHDINQPSDSSLGLQSLAEVRRLQNIKLPAR